MRDKWQRDINTGARGLVIGQRIVRNGKVKIDGDYFTDGYERLKPYEGDRVEVSVRDAWATEYSVRDAETMATIAYVRPVKKGE